MSAWLSAEELEIAAANRQTKRLPCLRCGRPMTTTRCQRICRRCTLINARIHGPDKELSLDQLIETSGTRPIKVARVFM